ncbi:hypothetical protein LLH00_13565 [bacterium]|nr:hypothetical protein [bacterium]
MKAIRSDKNNGPVYAWAGAVISAAVYFAVIDFAWVMLSLSGGKLI